MAASFALAFAGWEWAGRWPLSPAFPTFSATAAALGRMVVDGTLARAYLVTLQPLSIGILVSGAVGIAVGVVMGLSRAGEWLALPLVVIAQAAPMAAVIPLITYVYGIGLVAKVLAVVVLATPVVAMNSYKGIRNTSPSLLEMCRAFLGTRRQAVLKIILPHAAGLVFAGLRLGVAMGFIGVVIAELLITPTGIGDLITYHASVADYPEMFAAIASIITVGALAVQGLDRLERRWFPAETRGA